MAALCAALIALVMGASAGPDAPGRPPARIGHMAAVVDGRIYICGGDSVAAGPQQRLDCYRPADNSWTVLPAPPHIRALAAMVAVNERLYLLGGISREGPVPDIDVFDVRLGRWVESIAHEPLPSRVAAAVIGDEIYVIGGILADENIANHVCSTRVDSFNTMTGVWRRCADLTVGRHGHAAAVLDGRIYVTGGYSGSDQITSVEVYDPTIDRWEMGAHLLRPRAFHGMATVGDQLWVYGAHANDRSSEYVDPATKTWNEGPVMPQQRGRFASAVVDNRIYVIDGEPIQGETPATMQMYDTAARAWAIISEAEPVATRPQPSPG